MSIFFTSDNHFFHENVILYCNRPFQNADEMNDAMVDNWNKVVKPGDTVYHLGDFFMGKASDWPEIMAYLDGDIILIRGNHDKGTTTKYLNLGFKEVHNDLIREIDGKKVWMNHYPWHDYKRELLRPERNVKTYDIALCGHIHQHWKYKDGLFNVGVDVNNFTPISLNHVLEYLKDNKEN